VFHLFELGGIAAPTKFSKKAAAAAAASNHQVITDKV
jgi:hypothetical protein